MGAHHVRVVQFYLVDASVLDGVADLAQVEAAARGAQDRAAALVDAWQAGSQARPGGDHVIVKIALYIPPSRIGYN